MANYVGDPDYEQNAGYTPAKLYRTMSRESGTGLDMASSPDRAPAAAPVAAPPTIAQGAASAMNAGGSAGSVLTSAGAYGLLGDSALLGAGGATLGAGLALSAYEQSQKAKAMDEADKIQEAEQRKAAVQTALNQALGATRQLGV